MAKSGIYLKYSPPSPFTIPAKEFFRDGFITRERPRSALNYTSRTMEEIMLRIRQEYIRRELTPPTWKKYKSSITDFSTFIPNLDGTNLAGTPTKWFPQLIIDIQSAIDGLIADTRIPDSRAAFLARAFCNSQGIDRRPFDSENKLKDNVNVIVNGEISAINPLSRAKSGLWPFSDDYLKNCTTRLGVTPQGVAQVNVPTTDPNFPVSVIGATTPSGVAGFDVPMTANNRPSFGSRQTKNSSNVDVADRDQGYSYLAHLAQTIQAVRYQPPQVEWFPNNITARDYVSNLSSNTTPNRSWVFAQPVETTILQNWGNWLIKGFVGVENNQAVIRSYQNPSVAAGSLGQCPFSVFFPPPVAECGCTAGNTAYFIWWSNQYRGFSWDGLVLPQTADATPKFFNRNTRLKVKYTLTSSGGRNVIDSAFRIKVRTAKLGLVDVPFTTVATAGLGSQTIDINLMQAIKSAVPHYIIGGLDAIMALQLEVKGTSAANWECDAEDVPGLGRILPDECRSLFICEIPTMTARVDYVWLDEQNIVGDPVNSYI